MYAEVVAWSFRPGTLEAVRRTTDRVLWPAIRRQAGFRRWYLVRSGRDSFLTVALFDSREAAERSHRELAPLVRIHQGYLVESMERFAGPVEEQGVAPHSGDVAQARGGTSMTIGALFEIACNQSQYDEVMRRLEDAGEAAPAGRLYHVAGETADGWRVVDVWQSPELLQRFAGTLAPIMQAVGIPPVEPDIFPIHATIEGVVRAPA